MELGRGMYEIMNCEVRCGGTSYEFWREDETDDADELG
jgi:hypothetical protein